MLDLQLDRWHRVGQRVESHHATGEVRAFRERRHDRTFDAGTDEDRRVDTPRLSDAIDPADPLSKTSRIPRQFEVDHPACAGLEVEALSADIRGNQHGRAAVDEPAQRVATLGRRQSAVKH
jgi:hypothetical protein